MFGYGFLSFAGPISLLSLCIYVHACKWLDQNSLHIMCTEFFPSKSRSQIIHKVKHFMVVNVCNCGKIENIVFFLSKLC